MGVFIRKFKDARRRSAGNQRALAGVPAKTLSTGRSLSADESWWSR